MRWLKPYFGNRRDCVIAVVDYTFAAGTELDNFRKSVLSR